LPNPNVEILDAGAVAAHVQRIEVVDLNVPAAVISFARPELGVRLAHQNIARLYEGFTQAELVATSGAGEDSA
jgi:hypothetical protein